MQTIHIVAIVLSIYFYQIQSQNLNDQPQVAVNRIPKSSIHQSDECQSDINRLCLSDSSNSSPKRILTNIQVLQCIYNNVPDYNSIDKKCQNLLYEVKKNLTTNLKIDSSALDICKEDLTKLTECKSAVDENGHLTSCLIDNRDNITSSNCQEFVKTISALVFSDYRLIYKFVAHCDNDIKKFSCGRLEKDQDDSPTQQGKTIQCLTLKLNQLETECRKQIFRISELQSNDFHLDRPLYFACRDDREKLCQRILSGDGRVLDCLLRHKFNELMSKECRNQLTRRQRIISEDFRVDRKLFIACRRDIIENNCRDELRSNSSVSVKLSNVILCLEGVSRNGEKIDSNCRARIIEQRKYLMSDYQLSPDVVKKCENEVKVYCGGGIERGGKTLACLLKNGKNSLTKKSENSEFSSGCIAELRSLIKVADASEDISVDPDLQEACQSLLENQCKNVRPGEGRVISCLLSYLNKPQMNGDCEERLLDIQFFVSRDWKLTPSLFKACKDDAAKYCNANSKWNDWTTNVENGPLVLPCLFHLIHDDDDNESQEHSQESKTERPKISNECQIQVKKVMDYRAESIDLMPEIQNQCSNDLAAYCSQINLKNSGEELICLQKILNKLEDDCRKTIFKFTKAQNEDISLDKILMKACLPMIEEKCSSKKDQKGELLDCLIKQKNNPKIDEKCRIGIEHHQLLNMENVNLNFKFVKECKQEIVEHCKSLKSKLEVVHCLSEIILNDTLLEDQHRIRESCRTQLRFELIQLNENIKLDSKLDEACSNDVQQFCKSVTPGKGRVLECLRSNFKELSDDCRKKLSSRNKINVIEQKGDYSLQYICKLTIEKFCSTDGSEDVLSCLRKNLIKSGFGLACRNVVINRIMTQNSDIRLNPTLWKSCKKDVVNSCNYVFTSNKINEEALKGRVIKCLKRQFIKDNLSQVCSLKIEETMREAANIDYRLDPLLVEGCLTEIESFCSSSSNDKKEDCLRLAFQRGSIHRGTTCFEEVRRIIIEGAADIFVDHELSQACSIDLNRLCSHIAPGSAQQLKCLLSHKEGKERISAVCAEKLDSRQELWNLAEVPDSMKSFKDLAQYINKSEHRSYFLFSFFIIISAVFALGCVCRPSASQYRHSKLK